MSTIKTNEHARQKMWCDFCKRVSIEPLDEYTVLAGGNACQDCVPIVRDDTAKAGSLR